MRCAKKNAGFGAVEILIAIAIGTAIFLTASDLLLAQRTMVARLRAKLELSGIQLDLQQALSDAPTCIANFSGMRIDENRITDPNYVLDVAQIVDDAVTPNVLLSLNATPAKFNSSLKVSSMHAVGFTKLATDTFQFDFEVNITSTTDQTLVKALRLTRIRLTTAGPATAKVPQSCAYGNGGNQVGGCRIVKALSNINLGADAYCDPGEKAIAGGGACIASTGEAWQDVPVAPNEFGWLVLNRHISAGGAEGWSSDCYGPLPDPMKAEVDVLCCTQSGGG